MTQVRDRTVLITGAARGIGRRMALELAQEGARVVAWDLDQARGEALLKELPGHGHSLDVVDVADRPQVYAAADRVRTRVGPVDILINNAGVVSGKTLLEVPDEKIQATMNVNTMALFWTTKAFLPGMVQRNAGHVVTIASAAGLIGVRGLADYSASKFAAVGFAEALRMELRRTAKGVHTTLVCPYYIDTGMFDGVRTRIPWLLPILKEEDVAHAVVKAVRTNQEQVVLPPAVRLLAPLRVLPVPVFDLLATLLGVNASMDHFQGHREPPRQP